MSTAYALEWPLVGRSSALDQAMATIVSGKARLIHLVGPPGSGKSRLAAEVLRAAEKDGYPIAHVTASASAATVPLSALNALLPDQVSTTEPAAILDIAADYVRELSDGSQVVLHVDDIDALDAVSLALLSRLWQDGSLVVVATQRTGTKTPDVVLAEHRRGGVTRIEVADLDRAAAATLLHLVLRGPVSGAAEQAVWSVSGGNPLYLRELVTSSVLSGTLSEVDGVWVLDGRLDLGGGLAGLVSERIGHLEGPARELVELLALCAPLGADELAATYGFEVLESLESDGIVRVVTERRRQLVHLGHPVHAQVVSESLPRLRARRMLLDQVARSEAHGSRRRDDPLREAVWRLDATGTADVSLLVAAATLARRAHDYDLVERLSRAAILLEPEVRASTLLGEALYEQGKFAEADAVLTSARLALGDSPDPEAAARLGITHGIVLFFGFGRADEALTRLGQAARDVGESSGWQRSAITSMQALLMTQASRSADALAVLPASPPQGPGMRAVHSRARSWALQRTGRSADALAAALESWEEQTAAEDLDSLLHPAGDLMVAALAALELGDPPRARALAAQGRDAALGQNVHFQAAWLAWTVATIDLMTGYAEDARSAFLELVATSNRQGFGTVERLACLGMTECCALVGDAAGAAGWATRAEALPPAAPAFHVHTVLAQAWLSGANGDRRGAAVHCLDSGLTLLARGELREAMMMLDEATLFGSVEAAAALLARAHEVDTPVNAARASRARALLSGDPEDLVASARDWAACGFVHSAASMSARAATALRASGDPRAAAAAEASARTYALASPGLQVEGLGEVAGVALLTPREHEIATLVASGRTSKEVAGDLFLSVRTVDNHLANVYAKLGILGRAHLGSALALATDTAPPIGRRR